MKTLALHIGMHKTGTSSIQATLRDFDDGRTRYLQLGSENHSIPVYTIFSERRHAYNVHRRIGWSTEQIDLFAEQSEALLARELEMDRETLLISGEDISVLRATEVERLKDVLLKHVDRVRVLAYVRDPVSYAASALQQIIKSGHADPAVPSPRYVFRFKKFLESFGPEAIDFVPFEPDRFPGRSVVRDFCDRVGIAEGSYRERRVNESLSLPATHLLHILNQQPRPTLGNGTLSLARNRLVDCVDAAFPKPPFTLPESLVWQSLGADELPWLAQHAGIHFAGPRQCPSDETAPSTLRSELVRVTQDELAALDQLLLGEGVSCASSNSAGNMMVALYEEMLLRVQGEIERPGLRVWRALHCALPLARLARLVRSLRSYLARLRRKLRMPPAANL